MTDRITIRGIRGTGYHGVFDHERADGQPFSVDVTLSLDTSGAGRSDELAQTVDYGAVANEVHALIVGAPVDLIETLAERIADACLRWPAVDEVAVTVHKPQAPIEVPFDDVEVSITRRRDPDA
ncbi:MAG: dihydroneopterin aldolase [Actinomycetes bacterium]